MIKNNEKKSELKSGREISETLKLRHQFDLKSFGTDQNTEILYERAEKNTGEKLAGYYVQLFFLS